MATVGRSKDHFIVQSASKRMTQLRLGGRGEKRSKRDFCFSPASLLKCPTAGMLAWLLRQFWWPTSSKFFFLEFRFWKFGCPKAKVQPQTCFLSARACERRIRSFCGPTLLRSDTRCKLLGQRTQRHPTASTRYETCDINAAGARSSCRTNTVDGRCDVQVEITCNLKSDLISLPSVSSHPRIIQRCRRCCSLSS